MIKVKKKKKLDMRRYLNITQDKELIISTKKKSTFKTQPPKPNQQMGKRWKETFHK